MKTYIFPSVIERHSSELRSVTPQLLHGLKIYTNGEGYILGQLALSEGSSPHKAINSSPEDKDYMLLAQAGLMLASQEVKDPITLTVGFPYATFQRNRDRAIQKLEGRQYVEYEVGGDERKTATFEVGEVHVLPEILGAIISSRNEQKALQGEDFFMASLGYGTFEACLSRSSGVVQRTLVSTHGLRYAIDSAMEELQQDFYLDLRSEHQFDTSFKRGDIVIERKRKDITGVRKQALDRYYEEVISPALRDEWHDDDFADARSLLLTGGGTQYEPLVRRFEEEFGEFLDVQIVNEPMLAASKGYCLHSYEQSDDKGSSVGLDVGNANTVVCHFDEADEGVVYEGNEM